MSVSGSDVSFKSITGLGPNIKGNGGGGGGGAPTDVAYILLSGVGAAALTQYRVLIAGTDISIIDGGPLGNLVINNTAPEEDLSADGLQRWIQATGLDVDPGSCTHPKLTATSANTSLLAAVPPPAFAAGGRVDIGPMHLLTTLNVLLNMAYIGSGRGATLVDMGITFQAAAAAFSITSIVGVNFITNLCTIDMSVCPEALVLFSYCAFSSGCTIADPLNAVTSMIFINCFFTAAALTITGGSSIKFVSCIVEQSVTVNSSATETTGIFFWETDITGNVAINYTAADAVMVIDLSSTVVVGNITITGTGVCGAGSVTIKLPLKYASLIIAGTAGFVVDENSNVLHGTSIFLTLNGISNAISGSTRCLTVLGDANNISGTNSRVLVNSNFALVAGTNENTVISGGSSAPEQNSITDVTGSMISGITHLVSNTGSLMLTGYLNTVTGGGNMIVGGQQNTVTNGVVVGCDGLQNSILNTTSASISGQKNSIDGGSNNRIDGRLNAITTGVQCAIRGYDNVITGGNDTWIEGYACQFDGGVTNDINILKGYNVRLINALNHRFNMWLCAAGGVSAGAHGRAATTYVGSLLIATGIPTATSAFDNSGVVAPPVGYEANNTVAIYGDRIVMDCNNAGEMRCVGVNNLRSANAPATGDDYCNKTYVDSVVPVVTPSRAVWLLCLGNGSIPLANAPQSLWVDASGPGIHDGFYASLDAQINGAVNSGSAFSSGPDYTNASSSPGNVRFNHVTLPGAYIIDVVPPPTGSWEIEYKVNFAAGGALALPELYWSTDAAGLVVISGSAASPRPVTAGVQIEIYNKFIVQLVLGSTLYFWAYDGSATPGTIVSNRDDGFNWQFSIRQIAN